MPNASFSITHATIAGLKRTGSIEIMRKRIWADSAVPTKP
jgi:hypothetical protein